MRPATLLLLSFCLLLTNGCGYSQPVSEVQNQLKGYVQKVKVDIEKKDAASAKKNCDEVLAKTNLASHDRTSFEQLAYQCQKERWDDAKLTTDRMLGTAK